MPPVRTPAPNSARGKPYDRPTTPASSTTSTSNPSISPEVKQEQEERGPFNPFTQDPLKGDMAKNRSYAGVKKKATPKRRLGFHPSPTSSPSPPPIPRLSARRLRDMAHWGWERFNVDARGLYEELSHLQQGDSKSEGDGLIEGEDELSFNTDDLDGPSSSGEDAAPLSLEGPDGLAAREREDAVGGQVVEGEGAIMGSAERPIVLE